jgi:hypothetical protein
MTPRNRRFITVDYEAALDLVVSLRECLPPDHLAHFVVDVINPGKPPAMPGRHAEFDDSGNGKIEFPAMMLA